MNACWGQSDWSRGGWRRQDGEKEPLSELQMLLKVAVLSLFLFSREKDVQKGKSNTSFVALDVPKISKKWSEKNMGLMFQINVMLYSAQNHIIIIFYRYRAQDPLLRLSARKKHIFSIINVI